MSSNMMAQSYGIGITDIGITDRLISVPWPVGPSPDFQDAMLAAQLRERARIAAEAGEEKLAQALREAWEALTAQ